MLKRVDPLERHARREARRARGPKQNVTRGDLAARSLNRRDAKPSARAQKDAAIANANGQCEYVDPGTKERCSSRAFVQVDHVFPRSLGGEDALSNYRCLCAQHNRQMAEELLGVSSDRFAARKRRRSGDQAFR